MLREYTVDIPTARGIEQIALFERSEGEYPFLAWHGITAVNRFWYWDVLWDWGQVTLAGLPGHGPVRQYPREHYAGWSTEHFIDVGVQTARLVGGGRPMTLIGHSTGGMIGLGVAMRAPELVERLILISPVIWNDLRGLVGLWLKLCRWPDLARLVIAANLAPGKYFYPLMRLSMRTLISDPQGFYGNPLTDTTLRLALPHYRQTPVEGVLGTARVLRQTDLRPLIQSLRPSVPILLIHGDRDGIVPIEQSRWLARTLPNVKLVEVPGAGHVSWAEREWFVNEQVRQWCGLHPVER